MKKITALGLSLLCSAIEFVEDLFTDHNEDCKTEKTVNKKIYNTPTAIYCGWCDHDCAAYYKCSECGENFSSWDVKDDNCCPKCHKPLAGLQ